MKGFRTLFGMLAAAGILFSFSANAQENGNRDENGKIVRGAYETNSFGSNWFIGLGAGVNSYVGKTINFPGFGLATDVNVGKWFTPSVGARFGWHGIADKALAASGYTAQDPEGKYWYNALHADVLWNISNAFSGYKETRFWDIILYPSFSLAGVKGRGASSKVGLNLEYAAGFGWLNDFRLGKHVDLFIDINCMIVKEDYMGALPRENKFGYIPSATAGLIFNLGKTGFNRHSSVTPVVVPVPFTVDQYNALKNRVAELEKENAALRDEIEALKNQAPDTVYVGNAGAVESPATLYFDMGQTTLSERELAHLDFYIDKVMKNSEKTFTVTGSADKGTGSAKRNQYLSEKRAEFVKNYLVKNGVAEDKLVVKAEGDTNNRFAKAVLNRVVVIE